MSSRRNRLLIGGGLGIAVLIAVLFFVRGKAAAETEFVTKPAETGALRTVVNATGAVQPVVSVQVGTQVSGQILEIYADFNSVVKRGQLLARIDARNLEAQLTNVQGKVDAARSSVRASQAERDTSNASLESSKASLNEAQVAANNTGTLYVRAQDLSRQGLISKNDLDTARANSETAQARQRQAEAMVLQAQARLTSSNAQIEQAQAQLAQAEADLKQAQVTLGYTSITSPIDGVVISRSVDVGQTVAASLQSPTLFTIANDLTKMQVNASIDEADIGSISSSAEVRFTVDAYPGESFRGRIHEIRLSPTTVQNVVTYNAILDIDNPELKLKPGMTANISIVVDRRDRVLKIPNVALRYTPPGGEAQPVVPIENPKEEPPRNPQSAPAPGHQLAPGQKWNPADKVQLDRPREENLRRGRVWVLSAEGKPEARNLLLGITDGSTSEVISGPLKAGDPVIIGDSTQTTTRQQRAPVNNPLLPRMPGGGRRGM
jgi:HlyD family secretion protein